MLEPALEASSVRQTNLSGRPFSVAPRVHNVRVRTADPPFSVVRPTRSAPQRAQTVEAPLAASGMHMGGSQCSEHPRSSRVVPIPLPLPLFAIPAAAREPPSLCPAFRVSKRPRRSVPSPPLGTASTSGDEVALTRTDSCRPSLGISRSIGPAATRSFRAAQPFARRPATAISLTPPHSLR